MLNFKTGKTTYSKSQSKRRMTIAKISYHCVLNFKKIPDVSNAKENYKLFSKKQSKKKWLND